MSIPQAFVQELLSRVDAVELIGRYVPLKKAGANFLGLCPFHSEKSPSFSVSPSKQFYHCFGCGKSGDAIGFLVDHAGMSFVEAVQELAQQLGLPVPDDQARPEDRTRASWQRQKQQTLGEVLQQASLGYQKQLKSSASAVAYLKQRGVCGEVAKKFALGYAAPSWHGLASVFAAYDDPLLVESGLVIVNENDGEPARRYDRFRDRIMFPIRNVKGEYIGFGGRVLSDEKPKYLNSPETPVFNKGRELYGLFEARAALRQHGYALVTEGYMDVVALAQLGFPNTVATLGTACTAEHVHKLFRFTDSIVFSFDGDKAGQGAAHKALQAALPLANDVRSVKFLFLPTEHDPDSFIRAHGKEAFARYIEEAVPLSQFLLDVAHQGCDINHAEGRAHLASKARSLWQLLPAGALKQQLLLKIADVVQLSSRELSHIWQQAEQSSKRAAPPNGHRTDTGVFARSTLQHRSASTAPASSADHAARIVLGHMAVLEDVSSHDLSLLSHLPAPHGPLFAWLEAQFHEHGAQPWVALRHGLQGHASEALANRLMSAEELMGSDNNTHAASELRSLLKLMLIEQLKAAETQALEAAKSNPLALQRYRELQSQRKALAAGDAKSNPA